MKKEELQRTIRSIRLPQNSRERIIRNLEQISVGDPEHSNGEKYVFEVTPMKTPALRYAITSLAACAVLAVAAVGVYVAGRNGFSLLPEGTQQMLVGQQMSAEEMKAAAPEVFGSFAETPLFAVMGVNKIAAKEDAAFVVMTDGQKVQLAETLSILNWESSVQEYAYECEETDVCRLYFQYQGAWFSMLTAKDTDGQGWIEWVCEAGDAGESSNMVLQTDGAVIDQIRSIVSGEGWNGHASISYDDAMKDGKALRLIEEMCRYTAYNDLIVLSVEMDSGTRKTCLTTDTSGAYYVLSEEQKQEFMALNMNQLLLNMQNYSDLHMVNDTEGTADVRFYFENDPNSDHGNNTCLAFREEEGCILLHDMPSLPGCTFRFDITDRSLLKEYSALFESFKDNAERHETGASDLATLMEMMFPQTDMDAVIAEAEDIFCNLEQATIYFNNTWSGYLFENIYTDQYYSISEAQQKELAELMAGLPYSEMKENYGSGGYNIVMYLQDKNQRQRTVRFLFYDDFACAYMSWDPIAKTSYGNCYLELDLDTLDRIAEIIAEPEQLFRKEKLLYEFDDAMFPDSTDAVTEDSDSYAGFLDEYNEAHGTQLRLPTEEECGEAGVTMSECLAFFQTKFPDEETFFRYVDVLVGKRETVISNFHRFGLHGNAADENEVTGYGYYLYNASGQTYGSDFTEGDYVNPTHPDLIAVVTDEGIMKEDHSLTGYVTKEDLMEEPSPSTPEEAARMMKEREMAIANGTYEPKVCTVYDVDGKTIIGTFTFGN